MTLDETRENTSTCVTSDAHTSIVIVQVKARFISEYKLLPISLTLAMSVSHCNRRCRCSTSGEHSPEEFLHSAHGIADVEVELSDYGGIIRQWHTSSLLKVVPAPSIGMERVGGHRTPIPNIRWCVCRPVMMHAYHLATPVFFDLSFLQRHHYCGIKPHSRFHETKVHVHSRRTCDPVLTP